MFSLQAGGEMMLCEVLGVPARASLHIGAFDPAARQWQERETAQGCLGAAWAAEKFEGNLSDPFAGSPRGRLCLRGAGTGTGSDGPPAPQHPGRG